MTTFEESIEKLAQRVTTTNGMAALHSTSNPLTDLFYKIGSSRGTNIIPEFQLAFEYDPILASKIALWARDIREGAGERQIFRDILLHLEEVNPELLISILPKIPVLGRIDDLLVFRTKEVEHKAFQIIKEELYSGNKLCGKWLPREKSANKDVAIRLRKFLELSPKQYRKLLVESTDVVETKMCANQWNSIEFGKIPSLAAARYQVAFNRNAAEKYNQYREGLRNGTEKINSGAVYPYDVIKSVWNDGDIEVCSAQWNNLPNYMGNKNILPLVDVSGSMICPVGGNSNLFCLDVAVSLGLYCSDKIQGAFKDIFLTFSERPELVKLQGNLHEKLVQMKCSDWGMNTNLEACFQLILTMAIDNRIPEEEMPEILLILSDQQFDMAVENGHHSAIDMIRKQYQDANYKIPKIVYWNLSSHDNYPVRFDDDGTAMVSGFSPAIMKSILQAEEFTPVSIMIDTISNPRYDF